MEPADRRRERESDERERERTRRGGEGDFLNPR